MIAIVFAIPLFYCAMIAKAHPLIQLALTIPVLIAGYHFYWNGFRALLKGNPNMDSLVAIGTAFLFFKNSFNGAQFAVLIAVFATPVAVSSVPMSQEMKGDVTLAGQLVVWTTLFSSVSVFLASFLLKLGGVFA